MESNPWAEKARLLDSYRWLLLRERHGVLGSGVRFALEAITDWWFGVRARYRLANVIDSHACDYLLLQSAPKVIAFQRKVKFMARLREGGCSLVESALQTTDVILQQRMLKAPPHTVPTRYYGFAAYAEWLIEHHQPRILLNDRNGSLYAPFLRLSLNVRQRLLVHLAHATTVEASQRLGMNDYDYYFLFGRSSLAALQARTLRFGTSAAILAGSHMVDDTYDLTVADPAIRTVLVLGVGPDKEKEIGYQRTYELLREWARLNPEYRVLFKRHPRSPAAFWREAPNALTNIEVLDCQLCEALQMSSVVVNVMSNAVIESALARRPVIYVNASGQSDIFEQERFFGACVKDSAALMARFEYIEENYTLCVAQAELFAEYHLSERYAGLDKTIFYLDALLRKDELENVRLPQRL